MATFTVSQRINGDFQYNLEVSNGQVILHSNGYFEKSDCLATIELVRRLVAVDAAFECLSPSGDRFYFILRSPAGTILGMSERFFNAPAMRSGMASLKLMAPAASLVDSTALTSQRHT
ncbi:MAG: YegP family protein [Pseudobacter sp.]|uniref:YegP family protein n=1 Tax=Pseudobacter sp. TaxID=2045420 RepID=UPI003F7E2CFA